MHVTDADSFDSLHTSTAMLAAARTFDSFAWRTTTYEYVSDRLAIDLLYGDDTTRLNLDNGLDATAACAHHEPQRQEYLQVRKGFLHAGYVDGSSEARA